MTDGQQAQVFLTADVTGQPAIQASFWAGEIHGMLERIDGYPDRPDHDDLVGALALKLAMEYRAGEDMRFTMAAILWSAMRHPTCGEVVRSSVSRMLRKADEAHITWRFSPAGLLIGVASRFLDFPEPIAAAMIADGPVALEPVDGEDLQLQ